MQLLARGGRGDNVSMIKKAWIAGIVLAIGYVVGLIAAIRAGNNEATIALIGVGGPAVGAAAGVVGALAGATTQAQGAHRTAVLTTEAQARMKELELESAKALKKLELDASASQLRLEATFAWADRLYADLREFLTLCKLYGVEETTEGSKTQGIERLKRQQELDTLRDMLRLNPLIEADPALADRVNLAAHAVQYSIMDMELDTGELPPGIQLNELAAAVGRQLLSATGTAPGLRP
jgi:hypothetical protein